MKVGDRVSIVAREHGVRGDRVVVRALVRKHDRVGPNADEFVCVRVPERERIMLMLYPQDIELSQRGVSWAQGWHSREADALRVACAL